MGQVLGFAHCKEAPSTASTTPDSTEGGNEDSEFPELAPPEPPEEEEEDEDEAGGAAAAAGGGSPPRGPPRELTFSYIAFRGGGTPPQTEPGPPRCRRDPPRRGRAPRLSSGGSPRGPDPRAAARAPPPKRPEEPPAHPGGRLGEGGVPPELGGPEDGETPPSLAPSPPPPPPPPATPPEPPPPSAPPPAPPDQSASAAGADGQVWQLLSWRAPARSALALLVSLVSLGCLSRFSAVSVGAYGALGVLGVTVPLRLRRLALRLLRPPPPEPPPRAVPWPLTPEQQQRWARVLARHGAAAAQTLTRLFLVHSVPQSLKFAFLLYLLTYVGAAFNGTTLLGAGVICAFTFPVLHRRHQAQIEQFLSLGRSHLSHLRARVLAKLPGGAKAKPQ